LEEYPEDVRASLAAIDVDLARAERSHNLAIIDCYSPQIGMASKEEHSADPNNFSELSIAVSKALPSERNTRGLLVLDSLDTLIQRRQLTASLEFLRTLRAKTRLTKFDSIVTLNRQAFPTAILAAVQEGVDGVLEMKVQEEQAGLTRHIRVPKMRGAPHHTMWIAYELDFKGGLRSRQQT
jgi:KaiC/GvpD/RAD55 family RecA-like ATPase